MLLGQLPDSLKENQLQQRQDEANAGNQGISGRWIPDVDQEADGHGGQWSEAVVQHIDAHHPASEGVRHDGLNKCVVANAEYVLEESQACEQRHGQKIPGGLGKQQNEYAPANQPDQRGQPPGNHESSAGNDDCRDNATRANGSRQNSTGIRTPP